MRDTLTNDLRTRKSLQIFKTERKNCKSYGNNSCLKLLNHCQRSIDLYCSITQIPWLIYKEVAFQLNLSFINISGKIDVLTKS